ncbi:peptide-N4-(N-acetyl-beta-glucosaminyl)asparagine amidase A [Musa acuminata AAA Group]|uniref:peptide-N4-(N-acetyl-beta- glucosaminyl)asparagine amidase A n=1 Tax=Musa acuminata AAA Group TaxID=214697 RepID=UPI0031D601F7
MHPFLPRLSFFLILHLYFLPSSSLFDGDLMLPGPTMSLEHLDPTLPPALPSQPAYCSVVVLQQDFSDTVGSPPVSVNYTHPPDCPFPWTRVVLGLSLAVSGPQESRVGAVWIDGVEVLRTITPIPMAPGAFWRIDKDVTRYAALFRRLANGGGVVSMMLENSIAVLPGVFSANVSLRYYRGPLDDGQAASMPDVAHPSIRSLYHEPADVVLPVSKPDGYDGSGFWHRIDSETGVEATTVVIPRNAYRAVLEIFVSYHGDEDTWYTNPLRSEYLRQPTTAKLSASRANGAFRQVYATIDGRYVGGRVPFPVVYPSAINPFFWSPVTAIGAFDMPSYDLDLTPFLGLMLDGRPHEVGLGVRGAQPHWLVAANLHLWIDHWSDAVQAGPLEYFAPAIQMNRNAQWRNVDGESEVGAEGLERFAGWVSSSRGNLTTQVRHKTKMKSEVEVQNRGTASQSDFIFKERTTVTVLRGNQWMARVQAVVEAPMQVQTTVQNAVGAPALQKTRFFHQLMQTVSLNEGQSGATTTRELTDRQDAEGSAMTSGGWGSGKSRSAYRYKDGSRCYARNVNTAGGVVIQDKKASCAAMAGVA